MGPIFDLNEKLKEELVLNYGAKLARTILHEKGTFLIEEPFLETDIIWDSKELYSDIGPEKLKTVGKMIKAVKEEILKLGGYMTNPTIEWNKNFPVLVWAQFFTSENKKTL